MTEDTPQLPPSGDSQQPEAHPQQYSGEDELAPHPEENLTQQPESHSINVTVHEDTRIQDPEKAHVMALAGNEGRTEAALARGAAALSESISILDEETDPDGSLRENTRRREENYRNEAEGRDAIAEMDEERAGSQYDAEQQAIKDDETARSLESGPKQELSQEDQAKVLEHMASLLREHEISQAYRDAHLSMGFDLATAEGLVALGLKAHNQAQEFDRLRFTDPEQALQELEKAKVFVKILADIKNGVASDPDYQKSK